MKKYVQQLVAQWTSGICYVPWYPLVPRLIPEPYVQGGVLPTIYAAVQKKKLKKYDKLCNRFCLLYIFSSKKLHT